MKMPISNENELAKAIENKVNFIEIEGNLAQKTIKIKASGAVAWAVAVGALMVAFAVLLISINSGGISSKIPAIAENNISLPADANASVGVEKWDLSCLSTLEIWAIAIALLVAIIAAFTALFNKLKNYKIEKISNEHVKLYKK